MPAPPFRFFLLPALQACEDGQAHRTVDIVEAVADRLGLTLEDRRELVPSGNTTRATDRTLWAITYMTQARLLERPRPGHVRITERGRDLLAERPEQIDLDTLMRYEEFRRFRQRTRSSSGEGDPAPTSVPQPTPFPIPETPEEQIRAAALELEASLRSELLARIRGAEPRFFERLVVDLLVKMGYGSDLGGRAEAIGRSGDGGIDGMIDQDPLGLDRVYLQAKRYAEDNPVGSPAILQFSGALAQRGATRGVFITTSRFTEDARATAARLPQRIVLIDGDELARLLIRHDVGVRIAQTIQVKKIDEDFFLEE